MRRNRDRAWVKDNMTIQVSGRGGGGVLFEVVLLVFVDSRGRRRRWWRFVGVIKVLVVIILTLDRSVARSSTSGTSCSSRTIGLFWGVGGRGGGGRVGHRGNSLRRRETVDGSVGGADPSRLIGIGAEATCGRSVDLACIHTSSTAAASVPRRRHRSRGPWRLTSILKYRWGNWWLGVSRSGGGLCRVPLGQTGSMVRDSVSIAAILPWGRVEQGWRYCCWWWQWNLLSSIIWVEKGLKRCCGGWNWGGWFFIESIYWWVEWVAARARGVHRCEDGRRWSHCWGHGTSARCLGQLATSRKARAASIAENYSVFGGALIT